MDVKDTSQLVVIDETLLTTPKPTGTSTTKKYRIQRNEVLPKSGIENLPLSRASLGLLSLDDVDLTPTLERPRTIVADQDKLNVSQELQRQRHLAESLLSGRGGLTSMYLNSMIKSEKKIRMASESTIDDSDFLSNVSAVKSFYPSNISTPRSSTASVNLETSIGSNIVGNISLFADKLKNTDISIKDLCKQYESLRKIDESSMCDSFLSSDDQAAKMISEAELAWRQEYDSVPQQMHDSSFSNLRESLITDEKPSMGEFFKGKSDGCSSIFTKRSPEKATGPSALVSNSTMIDDSKNSIRSCNISNLNNIDEITPQSTYNVSDILRLISNESMSKSYLVECLVNNACKIRDDHSGLDIEKPKPIYESPRKANAHPAKTILQLAGSLSESLPQNRDNSLKLQLKIDSADLKNEMTTMKQFSTRKSLSPKRNVTKKVDYTDTFASEKLLSTIASSCKSSMEDLSDKENTASLRNVSPCGNTHCRSPNGSPNRSLSSLRSGSSVDHLIDGRVPVESTKIELVWATVRVGKAVNKEFVLRNKLHQKIRFQIMITGSCFKFSKPEGESQVPMSILLHPLESRSFTVAFAPTTIGAYAERLVIQSATKTNVQKPSQKILLYGYGGHISPEIRSLVKDSTGKYWLPLGHMDEINDIVTRNFTITNSGSLSAFVHYTVNLKHLQVFTGFKITPTVAVIPAGCAHQFQIRYVPNKDDFHRLKYVGTFNSNVCEVVGIKCVFGAEVLRGRIRRLANKLDGHINPSDTLISRIIEHIPEENIPCDTRMISESVASLKYLVQNLESKDILVTIEQDMDKTLVPNHIDSTSFQTLHFDTSDVTCIGQTLGLFNVHPMAVMLSPKIKQSDVIFLVNKSDKSIQYETRLSKVLVNVFPQSGVITRLNTSMIKIVCNEDIDLRQNHDLTLTVYSDISSFEVHIQIMCLNIPS